MGVRVLLLLLIRPGKRGAIASRKRRRGGEGIKLGCFDGGKEAANGWQFGFYSG